ncbi:MAG: tyrosine-type recombinase/integrase [Anaerolineales bacterium]|nr:tyrosine-type recombinase/integrase [Anaerolineales bacterium]
MKNFLETLRFEETHSENTIQAYIGDLTRFRTYLESKYRSVLFGGGMIPRYFTDFLESENLSGFSANTLQRRKMVLAQFAQYLTSIGEFTSDQVAEILNWRISLWHDIYLQDVEFLSDGDLKAILEADLASGVARSSRDKAIISILLETGLAISTVIELHIENIDLAQGKLRLSSGNMYEFEIPRSTQLIRTFIQEERPDMVQRSDETILFISQLGGPITRQGVWQMMKTIGDRLSPPIKLTPRVLRNTAVKQMIERELSISEIQDRLGHKNIYSTRGLVRKIRRTIEKQEAGDD